jgi:putative sigma-54 modulation protein
VNVTIHCHNVPLDQTLREYAEAKLRRLDRHFDRIVDARLELDLDGRKSVDPAKTAALYVHVSRNLLSAKVRARDLHEAVDLVIDKLDEQLRRRKERLTAHRGPRPA